MKANVHGFNSPTDYDEEPFLFSFKFPMAGTDLEEQVAAVAAVGLHAGGLAGWSAIDADVVDGVAGDADGGERLGR
jgi:hypothetical protein